jgi:hypothetical protein
MEPLELVRKMGDVFDSLGIPWVLGGSMVKSRIASGETSWAF